MSDVLDEAFLAAGWLGVTETWEDEAGHIHVEWNGRHVEAVCIEAAAIFIRRDAQEREQAECPHREWYTMNPPKCVACGKVGT